MAAGLFATLFAASSAGGSPSSSHRDTMSDDKEAPAVATTSSAALDGDVVMSAQSEQPASRLAPNEAQEVADVDMQLSSPPSSPPPSTPATPQHPPARQSVPIEAPSSSSAKQLGTTTGTSTPDPEPAISNATPTNQRASRRRTMPARLSQVSSLLAGSMLEEELLMLDAAPSPKASALPHSPSLAPTNASDAGASGVQRTFSHSQASANGLPKPVSILVLTSDTQLLDRAVYPHAPPQPDASSPPPVQVKKENDDGLAVPAGPVGRSPAPASTSLVSTLAIKRQQLIETPDFKPRDDTLYMPKTRGLRSEAAEDTSDAAYERRHRKPETAERKQRKAEVDRLARDRHKLLARIDQIKHVEARMLQPIVIARDQVRAEASAGTDEPALGRKSLHERVEDLRHELLADAYETLKRYDLLLSTSDHAKPASPAPATLPTKSERSARASTSASNDDAAARSESPRLKIRIKRGQVTREVSDSTSEAANNSSPTAAKADASRRISARQPKQRLDTLPTPLTAAAVEAAEVHRRKRRRLSSSHVQAASDTPPRTAPGSGRPQRAAAAAAAVASARQRHFAERSFSDLEYDDDDDDEEDDEVESVLDSVERPTGRRASLSMRRSPAKLRAQRSPSASSASSSCASMASSIGYMFPTVPDTGALKVAPSLVEIEAADPGATLEPGAGPTASPPRQEGGRRIKLVLSRSPSVAVGKKAAGEAASEFESEHESTTGEKRRGFAGALTESEAESILAAFLGTTRAAKSAAAPATANGTSAELKPSSAASAAPTTAAALAPSSALSKRRSTRRDTTQSFGEKLPEVLTKTAQFDFAVMRYLRSIDRPARASALQPKDPTEGQAR